MNVRTIVSLLRQSFADWNEDDAPRLGAALAFYTILSISPLVVLVIAAFSLVLNRSDVQARLLSQMQALIGPDGKHVIELVLSSSQRGTTGALASIAGVVTLLLGASAVFTELRSALNTIWETTPPEITGLWGMVRERLFSLGMVVSVGFVLLVSLVASASLAAVTKFFSQELPISPLLLHAVNFMVSFAGISFLFGCILRYVPAAKIEWSDVRVGAIGTALLFNIGVSLLGFYFARASPGSAYGAAGSLVVLVIWVYYSAQIFFFGAEFTHVYALCRRASRLPSVSA